MGIRPGTSNPALGIPLFTSVETTPQIPLGTIVIGFDDVAGTNSEYIYLLSPAAIVPNDEVTYANTTFLGTEVAAGSGQAVAINTSGAGQYTFFRLKRRGVIA
jgi:hypothetical protein